MTYFTCVVPLGDTWKLGYMACNECFIHHVYVCGRYQQNVLCPICGFHCNFAYCEATDLPLFHQSKGLCKQKSNKPIMLMWVGERSIWSKTKDTADTTCGQILLFLYTFNGACKRVIVFFYNKLATIH